MNLGQRLLNNKWREQTLPTYKMTDYTTRITASRNKIWQLQRALKPEYELVTAKDFQEQASAYGMLHNEYLELASLYKDMEKKGEKE